MKRVIVDFKKLTNEILSMLVEKYPDGYGDDDIIRFRNASNETIEAVEVRTDETTYLVKVSTKLADTMENFDDDEDDFDSDNADLENGNVQLPDNDDEDK